MLPPALILKGWKHMALPFSHHICDGWSSILDYKEEVCTFNFKKNFVLGVPEWLSELNIRLQLRSRSNGLWVQAPPRALC